MMAIFRKIVQAFTLPPKPPSKEETEREYKRIEREVVAARSHG